MNIALIIAGGKGSRTGQEIPKQYLTVNDKPIIVYALENVQNMAEIDSIVVVASKGWEDFVLSYAKQFAISKLETIVFGGETRHQSIFNGLKYIFDKYEDGDVVAITDAVRPLVPQKVFANSIKVVKEKGCCTLAVDRCADSMFSSIGGEEVEGLMDRDALYKGQTPECGDVKTLKENYSFAEKNNIQNITPTELSIKCGKKVELINGSAKSFKITTKEDIEIFKAILGVKNTNLI